MCPASTYKSYTGNRNSEDPIQDCTPCPNFTVSNLRSTEIFNCICKAGYTGPDGQACTPCAVDEYKDVNGSSACSVCPFNQTSPEASDDLSDCKCIAGYTGQDGVGCTECELHFYKDTVGSVECTACPANTFTQENAAESADDCVCDIGFNASALGVACSPCPPGTWKNITGSAACFDCPSNAITDPGEVFPHFSVTLRFHASAGTLRALLFRIVSSAACQKLDI